MNIQKSSSVNFAAARVLTARAGHDIHDIIKLDKFNVNDRNFVRRCQETMAQKSEEQKSNMKKFFKSFAESYKSPFTHDEEYYIGIKNGEKITGGYIAYPCHILDEQYSLRILESFNNKGNKLSKDCLFYSLLADAQKQPIDKVYTEGSTVLGKHRRGVVIEAEEIGSLKKQIKTQNPGVKFEETNIETDVEEFLGITDFETQVLRAINPT